MSDEIFLCQNVGLGSSPQAQHGRRSVGHGGALTTPRTGGVSIGHVLIVFETDHSHLLKILHRSSGNINNKN